jgi:excisionase family DNA binding protein
VVNQMEVEHQTATATAIDEWLTVAEVAAWLKVSRSWVYEHTRNRGAAQRERLPYVKLGKYVRRERRQVSAFLERRMTRS